MPSTSINGLRYPASSAAPNVAQDLQNLANDVDSRLRPVPAIYRAPNWSAVTYAATNNYNLTSITIPATDRPYFVIMHASATCDFSFGAAVGSLRINLSGTGIVGSDVLNNSKPSAQAFRMQYIGDPTVIYTVTANIEVLTGSIRTYNDASHSFLEVTTFSR